MLQVLRLDAVEKMVGLKHSTIYAKVAEGSFPKPIKLSAKAVGWLESDIQAWLEALVSARDAGAA